MKDRTQELRTVSNSDRTVEAGRFPRWREGEKAMARQPDGESCAATGGSPPSLVSDSCFSSESGGTGRPWEKLGGGRAGKAAVATFSFF